jgi:hypothetical protein
MAIKITIIPTSSSITVHQKPIIQLLLLYLALFAVGIKLSIVHLIVLVAVFLLHFDLDGFLICHLSLLNLEIQHAILESSRDFSSLYY